MNTTLTREQEQIAQEIALCSPSEQDTVRLVNLLQRYNPDASVVTLVKAVQSAGRATYDEALTSIRDLKPKTALWLVYPKNKSERNEEVRGRAWDIWLTHLNVLKSIN